MKRANGRIRFAVCVNNEDYQASLEIGKVYQVLADAKAAKHGLTRVIDESGEDYLYPEDWFHPVKLPSSVRHALVQAAS
ncbi:MAG TPA: hypothetical protein VL486_07140 [Verrucomicrobiae bacterium]|nr:hypothetical protein [Verrucomicrobiae bacterium]